MSTTAPELKAAVSAAMAAGRGREAAARLRELWLQAPTLATAQFIAKQFEALNGQIPLKALKVHIVRSFTLEPAALLLRAMGYLASFQLEVSVGGFDAYAQELLDESSAVYAGRPDVVFVAVQTRAVAPDLWSQFSSLSETEVEAAVARVLRSYRSWVNAFRSRSQGHLVLHTLEAPTYGSGGLLDAISPRSQREAIGRINAGLRELALGTPGVHLLDYEGLVARHGGLGWEDPQKWASIRMPLTAESLVHLAGEWLRFLHPIGGRTAKVLVCDLDNTLWGGVLGEDGPEGLQIGDDYPGAGYRGLQRAILDLYRRGIILAICSKNDEREALAALREHPGMLLRPEHFAAWRINWQDKATNLREIAAELNVGIDSLALLDDNPHEREWVRAQLPEVAVIELPADAMQYERVLREQAVFERLAVTEEDRQRGQMYAEQRQRRELEAGAETLEDYYRSLQLAVQVEPVGAGTLERAGQLIQKTNQFNLTGRRYTAQELAAMMACPEWLLLATRVRDRFGDSGIVGVTVARVADGCCSIEAMVMSCRVIGRTVETAMLAALMRQAAERGAGRVEGRFVPSPRNEPARDFYSKHGFRCAQESAAGSRWEYDLARGRVECPAWIELEMAEEKVAV